MRARPCRGAQVFGSAPTSQSERDAISASARIAREEDLQIGETVHLVAGREDVVYLGVTAGGRFAFARIRGSRRDRLLVLDAPVVFTTQAPGNARRGLRRRVAT